MQTTDTSWQKAVIAVNRFGLGAKPGELEKAVKDPIKYTLSQLQTISFEDKLPSSNEVLKAIVLYREEKKGQKEQSKKAPEAANTMLENSMNDGDEAMMSAKQDPVKKLQKYPRQALRAFSVSHAIQAVQSENSVSWRLLDFFSNHFSVSASGLDMAGLAATLEREAIAPNLLANFEDMLLAVTKHPAMLLYLNNERSFGPNSRIAQRTQKGMNENLAREILELHTLGVDGGYSQADVIELAKGITGWSFQMPKKNKPSGFIYRAQGHEPGPRTLLGKTYNQSGVKQGEAMLKDLANHPNTIKHISYKLARHFISDNPAPALVNKIEQAWQQSGGNLKAVMTALISAEEAWHIAAEKFKTPREFVLSTLRALDLNNVDPKKLYNSFTVLGQQPYNAGSPAGFSDVKEDWNGSSALMARINWANTVAAMAKINTEQVLKNSFANTMDTHSYKVISRAESRKQGLTLLLMSPEFQMR